MDIYVRAIWRNERKTMKASNSSYLTTKKPVFQELLQRLLQEYPYASILVEDNCGKNLTISGAGESVAPSEISTNRGFVVRIHDGNGFGEYAGNELSEAVIPGILQEIRSMLPFRSQDALPAEEPLVQTFASELEQDPATVCDAVLLEQMRDLRNQMMASNKALTDCLVLCGYRYIHKLFLSPQRDLEQDIVTFNTYLGVYAGTGSGLKSLYTGTGGVGGAELFQNAERLLSKLSEDVADLLNSHPMEPGTYTCICSPDVSGLIAHESFGHGVETDMFVKKRALAAHFMGKPVASEKISMRDSGCIPKAGMYFFDDEGNLPTDTQIIDKGILVAGLSDQLSAVRLAAPHTGNGRRQNYTRKAYARMSNTWFEPGTDNLEDMIAATEYGFLLDYVASGMEDPKNWGIQCVVTMAREISGGTLTGRVYSPCILTGYVPDLLKSVDMVSREYEVSGASSCGKGFKEMITVSTGGPWMRAKIRLG